MASYHEGLNIFTFTRKIVCTKYIKYFMHVSNTCLYKIIVFTHKIIVYSQFVSSRQPFKACQDIVNFFLQQKNIDMSFGAITTVLKMLIYVTHPLINVIIV